MKHAPVGGTGCPQAELPCHGAGRAGRGGASEEGAERAGGPRGALRGLLRLLPYTPPTLFFRSCTFYSTNLKSNSSLSKAKARKSLKYQESKKKRRWKSDFGFRL